MQGEPVLRFNGSVSVGRKENIFVGCVNLRVIPCMNFSRGVDSGYVVSDR